MLIDRHDFKYVVTVPWPHNNYYHAAGEIELWLDTHIGWHHSLWAWNDSLDPKKVGVAFRWDHHRSFFLLHWIR